MIVTGYLGLLTVAGASSSRRRRPPDRSVPVHRFVVLVPAHDEQPSIGATLASLRAVDYPGDLFAVHVVADNCTDGTADIVRHNGFEAHERTDRAHPGKGPALQWLLERLGDRGDQFDAVAFVDADTTMDPAFLRVMDGHLTEGARVVQGHYAVRDEGSSPVVAFRSAALAARTFLRPLGRTAIGGSAGLHGNGMVFRREQLADRRWSDHLTEDVELHLDLLIDGTLVSFAPAARVEAEMPDTLASSRAQHERWERGRLELARRYVPGLIHRAVAGGPSGRVAYADAALDQLVPPLSVTVFATSGWLAAAGLRALTRRTPGTRRDLGLALAASLGQAAHVLFALRLVHAPASTYRALSQAPRMIIWKLGLWLRVLARPNGVTWTRTARNAPNTAPH